MSRADRAVFVAFAFGVLLYLVARAWCVPITHDEARTYFIYVLSGEFIPWHSFWDAGNHVLCSALGRFSFMLTGMSPFSLRSANLMAYVLYALYIWRVGAFVYDRWVRWCMWCALLFTPGMIEFFALFRGYGLSFAFLLMALYHTVVYLRSPITRDLVWALLAWSLAGWSMLSVSLVWCAGIGLFFFGVCGNVVVARDRIKPIVIWSIMGVVPLVFGLLYGSALRSRGLLYDGTEDGLINGTFRLLLNTLFATGDGVQFRWCISAILFSLLVSFALFLSAPRENWKRALIVIALLMLAEGVGRVLLWNVSGVRFPMGRTALHWVPLLVIGSALAVDILATRFRLLAVLALPLLALPLRAWNMIDLSRTSVWPEEALAPELFHVVEDLQMNAGRPLLIDAYEQMGAQWDYSRQYAGHAVPPISSNGFPQPICDLVFVDTLGFRPPHGFHAVPVRVPARQTLYARDAPLSIAELGDSTVSHAMSTDEFVGLPWPFSEIALTGPSALEFTLVVRSPDANVTARLAVEVSDTIGHHLHYELIDLRQLQRTWQGDTLHFIRRVPMPSVAHAKALIYIWDPDRQELELTFGRVRSLRIGTDLRDH